MGNLNSSICRVSILFDSTTTSLLVCDYDNDCIISIPTNLASCSDNGTASSRTLLNFSEASTLVKGVLTPCGLAQCNGNYYVFEREESRILHFSRQDDASLKLQNKFPFPTQTTQPNQSTQIPSPLIVRDMLLLAPNVFCFASSNPPAIHLMDSSTGRYISSPIRFLPELLSIAYVNGTLLCCGFGSKAVHRFKIDLQKFFIEPETPWDVLFQPICIHFDHDSQIISVLDSQKLRLFSADFVELDQTVSISPGYFRHCLSSTSTSSYVWLLSSSGENILQLTLPLLSRISNLSEAAYQVIPTSPSTSLPPSNEAPSTPILLTPPHLRDINSRVSSPVIISTSSSPPTPQPSFSQPLLIQHSQVSYSDNNRLGTGSFGNVYIGEYKGLSVAVKELKGEDLQSTADFLNEAGVMTNLSSPLLVKLMGICLEPQLIVMELMGGGSLFDLLHKSTPIDLPWAKKIHILREIARGIQFLHQHDVAHRDLKSANILLSHDHQQIKLADFGFSRKVNSMTGMLETVSVRGTPFYMAPELLSTSPSSSTSGISGLPCDIYAFGIMMWEVGFRKIPHNELALNLIEFSSQVIHECLRPAIDIQHGLSNEFVPLMRSCWGHLPLLRPKIAEVLDTLLRFEAQSRSPSDHYHLDSANFTYGHGVGGPSSSVSCADTGVVPSQIAQSLIPSSSCINLLTKDKLVHLTSLKKKHGLSRIIEVLSDLILIFNCCRRN